MTILDIVEMEVETRVVMIIPVIRKQKHESKKTNTVILSAANNWESAYRSQHNIMARGKADWIVMQADFTLENIDNLCKVMGVSIQ